MRGMAEGCRFGSEGADLDRDDESERVLTRTWYFGCKPGVQIISGQLQHAFSPGKRAHTVSQGQFKPKRGAVECTTGLAANACTYATSLAWSPQGGSEPQPTV